MPLLFFIAFPNPSQDFSLVYLNFSVSFLVDIVTVPYWFRFFSPQVLPPFQLVFLCCSSVCFSSFVILLAPHVFMLLQYYIFVMLVLLFFKMVAYLSPYVSFTSLVLSSVCRFCCGIYSIFNCSLPTVNGLLILTSLVILLPILLIGIWCITDFLSLLCSCLVNLCIYLSSSIVFLTIRSSKIKKSVKFASLLFCVLSL